MADERTSLLPVVIDGTRDAEAKVPGEFKSVQWTKLMVGETPPAFCERVKSLLGGEQERLQPRFEGTTTTASRLKPLLRESQRGSSPPSSVRVSPSAPCS